MNLIEYHKTISTELNAVKNRIRQLMNNPHFPTDGELKESVLRSIIRRYIPGNISVGRGFIHNGERCSEQIDILLYSNDYPVLFREGDLVFITPDAVVGIIEVKTNLNFTTLRNAIQQLNSQVEIVGDICCFAGLFSYDYQGEYSEQILERICTETRVEGHGSRINHIVLGNKLLFKYWSIDPITEVPCSKWHAYELVELSYAYFINNLVANVSSSSVNANSRLWFPIHSKEHANFKKGECNLWFNI